MKKTFWKTTVGIITKNILTLGIGLIIKNQKGIKGNSKNEQIVDDILK